ncbi:MAG TPA: hypothetical protein VNW51_08775, partial [Mucilaginibacter sp.]|nr:hypothetical protein [Mucilaginibacter sp.]
NLKKIIHQKERTETPVFKTIATTSQGIDEVAQFILSAQNIKNTRKEFLMAEKAYKLIREKRMAGIDKKKLRQDIAEALHDEGFNLYNFVSNIDS